ncbi:MAG: sulfotransferase [Chloroflexota bacterium]|nr:sulfotransferase [Chloroflexota bacterium]
MTEHYYNIVVIGGFGGTGSSAIVDLLKEFDTFQDLGIELRLLVDPDGIMSLENALVSSWTPYQSDIAIKRFKKLIYRLSSMYRYPYLGTDHTRSLGDQFVYLSNEYLNRLVSFSYNGLWVGINDPLSVLGYRINRRLGRDIFRLYKPIHISLEKDRFVSITREYLDNLINLRVHDSKIRNVIIDEGFASLNPFRILNYFYSAKSIIAHRDPRDTFVNALKYSFRFIPRDVENFIKWYEHMQIQSERGSGNDDRILRIHFEDLVLDYEKTVSKILFFLSTDESAHIRKRRFFNPDVSMENVGLWKQYENQDEVERIYTSLARYCYDSEAFGSS